MFEITGAAYGIGRSWQASLSAVRLRIRGDRLDQMRAMSYKQIAGMVEEVLLSANINRAAYVSVHPITRRARAWSDRSNYSSIPYNRRFVELVQRREGCCLFRKKFG